MVVAETWKQDPEVGPVGLLLSFYLPVPGSWSKKRRLAALSGKILPAKKPDLDNLVKAVIDALLGVLIMDDRQIVELSAAKFYGSVPGVKIVVSLPDPKILEGKNGAIPNSKGI